MDFDFCPHSIIPVTLNPEYPPGDRTFSYFAKVFDSKKAILGTPVSFGPLDTPLRVGRDSQ